MFKIMLAMLFCFFVLCTAFGQDASTFTPNQQKVVRKLRIKHADARIILNFLLGGKNG